MSERKFLQNAGIFTSAALFSLMQSCTQPKPIETKSLTFDEIRQINSDIKYGERLTNHLMNARKGGPDVLNSGISEIDGVFTLCGPNSPSYQPKNPKEAYIDSASGRYFPDEVQSKGIHTQECNDVIRKVLVARGNLNDLSQKLYPNLFGGKK